jgi:triosephosphate isomerase
MRIPFIVGNWKMYTDSVEAESLAVSLKRLLADVKDVDVAVCPPFPYLRMVCEVLKDSRILTGAQNMCWETEGAYTGEVSPRMLKDVGCDLVILGHSERRHIFQETDEIVNKKIRKALEYDLSPIVCVGETLDEREAGKTEEVVLKQIEGCLEELSAEDLGKITVAYEPVWAIGTGRTATPEQAQEVHVLIRDWLAGQFSRGIADDVRIQYGGSVKPENAAGLMAQPDIDGALVGGASLKAENFSVIVNEAR